MPDGYSRSPKFLKGAIVQFVEMPIIPIPNIIVFQYNPETLSRSMTAFEPPDEDKAKTQDYDAPFDPGEEFSVTLLLDASDALEAPDSHPVAFVSGVADRIAALEVLLYPVTEGLAGKLTGSLSVSVSAPGVDASLDAGGTASVVQPERPKMPVTLFIWGPGRIVPVRLKQLTIEEQAWNQLLYPTRAKVTVQMRVLTSAALEAAKREGKSAENGIELAQFCADFTRTQREVLAIANVANTVESILGILPF